MVQRASRIWGNYVYSCNVPVNSKTTHARPPPPPPGQTPGHLTFLKNFGQIPRYVGSLEGQMPHWLELQRVSNPPNQIFVFYDEDSGW